mmetsp:Transcript_14030/g.30456  ORF Transcript_14030/g.30456 Transcript_14030/m.30456 type:complete len:220 (-) Transcript_14030:301-960(-)
MIMVIMSVDYLHYSLLVSFHLETPSTVHRETRAPSIAPTVIQFQLKFLNRHTQRFVNTSTRFIRAQPASTIKSLKAALRRLRMKSHDKSSAELQFFCHFFVHARSESPNLHVHYLKHFRTLMARLVNERARAEGGASARCSMDQFLIQCQRHPPLRIRILHLTLFPSAVIPPHPIILRLRIPPAHKKLPPIGELHIPVAFFGVPRKHLKRALSQDVLVQ